MTFGAAAEPSRAPSADESADERFAREMWEASARVARALGLCPECGDVKHVELDGTLTCLRCEAAGGI